jgi:hypothetical protein
MRLRHRDVPFTHIANENQHRKAKEGLLSGVPDYFIMVAKNDKHGLFIEIKRQKGGILSKNQKMTILKLEEQGYECRVCNGWRSAAQAVCDYLDEECKV